MEALAAWTEEESRLTLPSPTLTLRCTECGYGIARSTPPARCPMCQSAESWAFSVWQPLTRDRRL